MSQAVPEPPASTTHVHTAPKVSGPGDLAKLALGALGVVYGDIGTSPLYAMKECFEPGHGMDPSRANVLGVLSLFVWSLTLVVVVKYLSFIMRADNKGEGGILALLALLKPRRSEKPVIGLPILVLLGLFGSALLYGDGMITPAISVLSAVEGLGVATNKLDPVVVPITVIILIVLFVVQKRGTAGIGAVFGPAMLLWFVAIAAAGIPWVLRQPEVLRAVDPRYAINFMLHHKWHGFLVLGSVVLCITGGEALYADMGHFGKKPIRWAWYAVVLPALLCNYFGQAALYLANEGHPPEHPFYGLVSGWALYPMVGIATVATVVASQALISGAYSLTQQAVQLGYCPRVTIKHTSGSAEGQIYVPEVNNALMVACVTLVLVFQKSSNLAAAYGIAVTGTMSITSLLFSAVAVSRWKWRPVFVFMLVGGFMIIDLAFFGANVVKLKPSPEHPIQGGWFPLVVGAVIFTVMTTWKRGREALGDFIRSATLPLDMFMADVTATKPHRVKGTAVFMTSNPEGAPPVLLHHFKHNKTLHQQIVLLSIQTAHEPEVPDDQRITRVVDLGDGFYQVIAIYGFMQTPNVLDVLESLSSREGVAIDREDTSFFLGRETLLITGRSKMARWRKVLFTFLSKNARPANAFFQIPPNRVVELGTQIEL